ncbi:MAG: monovalent cation/H+ antiporter complex subunit F [Kiritimatiellae bacterium]|nr:monovalent cation/H+ antiporter complex subunit F [Kiritimatiellia bacterium]MDW8459323.1 monovalent cation/H+ antiporter complex subunit F [Verrucomicrobiota bacterium]
MSSWLSPLAQAMMGLLCLAMLLALYRVIRGPSLADRAVAVDLLTTVAVGLIALYAIDTGQQVFLSAGIALALLAFLGTVALALYIRRGGPP